MFLEKKKKEDTSPGFLNIFERKREEWEKERKEIDADLNDFVSAMNMPYKDRRK